MSALLGRRRVLVAIIFVLVAVVATELVVLAATTVVRQGDVEYMKVASTTDLAYTEVGMQWIDVPGTALAMPIPSGEHDFFQITFSVDAPSCARLDPGANFAVCYVSALVDGQQVSPAYIQFGSSDLGPLRRPATMQWVSGVLAPGTHYVKMQYRVGDLGNAMGLTARTMTVVRVRAY